MRSVFFSLLGMNIFITASTEERCEDHQQVQGDSLIQARRSSAVSSTPINFSDYEYQYNSTISMAAQALQLPANKSMPPQSQALAITPGPPSTTLSFIGAPGHAQSPAPGNPTLTAAAAAAPDVQFCDPPETEEAQKLIRIQIDPSTLPGTPIPWTESFFQQLVGAAGVLMLSTERMKERSTFAANQLSLIGIYPTFLPSSDGYCASRPQLAKGCADKTQTSAERCKAQSRAGEGCQSPFEQGVADSHRRALEIALKRKFEWTAIFEDDAIPVFDASVDWNKEFEKAWAVKPPEAKIVRLSWCLPPNTQQMETPTQRTHGGGLFQWVQSHDSAGCTAAYMVHNSVIPEMLKAFPCCCAVDCCYAWDVFKRLKSALINLAAIGGEDWIQKNEVSDWGGSTSDGVIMQAKVKHDVQSARVSQPRPTIFGFTQKYTLRKNGSSVVLVEK